MWIINNGLINWRIYVSQYFNMLSSNQGVNQVPKYVFIPKYIPFFIRPSWQISRVSKFN